MTNVVMSLLKEMVTVCGEHKVNEKLSMLYSKFNSQEFFSSPNFVNLLKRVL